MRRPIIPRFAQIATLFLVFYAAIATGAPSRPASRQCLLEVLEQRVLHNTDPRAAYRPILSTDLDYLRNEARFAEGPAPQKNMGILSPQYQFRFSDQTKAIFELKKRLLSRFRDRIIDVKKGHETAVLDAVREQFAMALRELPETAPKDFRREGDTLINLLTGDRVSLSELHSTKDPRWAIEKLGEMVPDDLIFMKKDGEEYHLIGGSLAFPTRWNIRDELGASITDIHVALSADPAKVAAFSAMINRVLDRTLVTPEVVRRNNWFIETDPRYPLPSYQTTDYAAPRRIDERNYRDSLFIRSERQTLRGLPESKVVVFGIQPFVFSMRRVLQDRTLTENLLNGIRVKLLPDADTPRYVRKLVTYLERDLARAEPPPAPAAALAGAPVASRVLSGDRVTGTSHLLRIEKPPGIQLVPGAAIRVTLQTPSGEASRTLSLTSSPEKSYLELAVRDSESDFKRAFTSLKAGDSVRIAVTGGSLGFNSEKPAVMIAGGIGITPFRSFIQYAKDKNLGTPMWLFYGNREDIPFQKELDEHAAENSRLSVTHVLSRAGPEWSGKRGRVDDAFLGDAVPKLPGNAIYYVVGSPQMVADTKVSLERLGIASDRISYEVFPTSESKAEFDPKKAPDRQTVCYCYNVSAGALRQAVRNGAKTLAELQSSTLAATGCGGCKCNILGLLQCEMSK